MNFTATLLIGMTLGLGFALWDLLGARTANLDAEVVALVDGQEIARRDWQRAIDGITKARRRPPDSEEKRAVLQRLIDEQLLISHGLELDLVRRTPSLRKQTVAAVLELYRGGAETRPVQEVELQRFYAAHRAYFAQENQYQLALYRHPELSTIKQARAALLRGDTAGLSRSPSVPLALLPHSRLSALLGAELSGHLADLQAGELSQPIRSAEDYALLHVLQKQHGTTPDLQTIAPRVEAEYRRRQGELELRELLQDLRRRHSVTVIDLEP